MDAADACSNRKSCRAVRPTSSQIGSADCERAREAKASTVKILLADDMVLERADADPSLAI